MFFKNITSKCKHFIVAMNYHKCSFLSWKSHLESNKFIWHLFYKETCIPVRKAVTKYLFGILSFSKKLIANMKKKKGELTGNLHRRGVIYRGLRAIDPFFDMLENWSEQLSTLNLLLAFLGGQRRWWLLKLGD